MGRSSGNHARPCLGEERHGGNAAGGQRDTEAPAEAVTPLDVGNVDKGTDQGARRVLENQSEGSREQAGHIKPLAVGVGGGRVLRRLLDREGAPVGAPPHHRPGTEADVPRSVQAAQRCEPLSGRVSEVEGENDDLLKGPVVSV